MNSATSQVRIEIHALIKRYGQESSLTVYELIGVLECVKMDLWEMLELARRDKDVK